ncbi:MAG: hypothetical protein LBE74_02415 [Treponema sp.]|jgi:hypothetical protein|nr:hypothetical protein [Treponema sp.]
MIRLEIIANHSVEENILEELHNLSVGAFYTKFPGVLGVGSSGPRMGDAVWPEENFVLVIWCERPEAAVIERAVARVKEKFPDEGMKVFKLNDAPPQQVYLPPPPIQSPPAQPPSTPPVTERSAAVDPFAPTFAPPPAEKWKADDKPLGIESENS